MKLLYLEDQEIDADLTRRALARAMPDLQVNVAGTLAEARGLLDGGGDFDLALLDLRLPDGEGLDLLAEIRGRELPVAIVLLTGAGDEQTVVRALKLHADDYLIKHGDYLGRLPATLRAALERFHQERNLRSQPLRVLYAEHNADDADLTRRHFARHAQHIQLDVVAGAASVLRRLEADGGGGGYQLLLLDYRLAGMDALELVKALRQNGVGLPIVLVTGRGSEEVAAAALRLGVSDYLIKDAAYLDKLPAVLERAYIHAELNRERARLHYLASYDVLTGLPNRVEFHDRATQALSRAERRQESCALLLVDLDNFKMVNDSFGHAAGDVLLQSFAQRLLKVVRQEDICCRFGGDEFLVLQLGTSLAGGAGRVAERIAEMLEQGFSVGSHDIVVNASIGISLFPQDGRDVDSLVKNADTAMYKAKAGGRNHFRFFDATMNLEVTERFSLEADLRRALDRDELFLVFQPQVDLRTGRALGVEALLRWRHPQRGLVEPERFIPVAESSGLIVPLGEWVLEAACRRLREWIAEGVPPVRMAVNLSARQFRSRGLVASIESMLRHYAVPARRLELDLTETTVADDHRAAARTLERLKNVGVELAVDDFGTGYSSLSHLKHYPLDRLKIDRGFVGDIGHDPNDAAIAAAVVSLALALDLEAVAEGVETPEQLDFLRRRNCHIAQGFLISRPLEAESATLWLTENSLNT
jgi:diguanylate cyclase (GGDEF)-like protein